LSGTRKVMDVIFSHTNRNADVVEKFFARVDVTEESPSMEATLVAANDSLDLNDECPFPVSN
jgi:hypothetical protein